MATRRRSEPQQGQKPLKSGKLPVAQPTSFGKFFVILLMHVCRKILLINTTHRLLLYVAGVSIVSLVSDMVSTRLPSVPGPQFYFARKDNFFNVYFVKIGWGWTVTLLGIFIYLTSTVYCIGDKQLVKRHLLRLAVGTFWWFFCTSIFRYVEGITGYCSLDEYDTKSKCLQNTGTWMGFDISGHAFLLVHCLLMISEEIKSFSGWERIEDIIVSADELPPAQKLSDAEVNELAESYDTLTPYVRAVVGALAILNIIWEMMLLSTSLYFHNMPQKVTGVSFAALGWFLTYQSLYKLDVPFSLGLPGKGRLKYQKDI